LLDVDTILKDCQDLPVLAHYFKIFKERYKNGKKKEDLDRLISILTEFLKLVPEEGAEGLIAEFRRSAG